MTHDNPSKPVSKEEHYKTYLFEYFHRGATWVFEINASSIEDAKERVQKLYWARYVGELKAVFPMGFGLLAKLFCFFHSHKL